MHVFLKPTSSFTLFIIMVLIYYANGYTFNGYEIRDLESNTSYLATEVQSWTTTNSLTSSNVSQCGATWILGGYGIFQQGTTFTRTYSSLPSHSLIYFSFDAWFIDLQETTNIFQLYFDNVLVETYTPANYGGAIPPYSYVCGTSTIDFPALNIGGQYAHNSNQLTVKFVSSKTSSNSFSVGFRNLNLLFQNATPAATSVCYLTSYTGTQSSCVCGEGKYDPSGSATCTPCNTLCQTCYGGSSALQCTSCPAGYSYNGQRCYQCASTCSQCTNSSQTGCLRCYTGNYLYWNGTCKSSCNSPLVPSTVGDNQYCNRPCDANEYLYPNGLCDTQCNGTSSVTQDGVSLCQPSSTPAASSNSTNTTMNTTANTTTPTNSTSSSTSNSTTNSSSSSNTTNTTASTTTNSTSSSTPNTTTSPSTDSTSNSTTNSTDTARAEVLGATLDSIASLTSSAGAVFRGSNSNSGFMIALSKLVKYVKYIQVPMNENVRDILVSNTSDSFSFTTMFYYHMPAALQAKFVKQDIPDAFSIGVSHSSYLVNQWDSLSSFVSLFGLGLVGLLLEKIVSRFNNRIATLIVRRIRVITTWNFLLFIIFNTYDDLTFFALIEFMTVKFDSASAIISFITCIVVTCGAIYLLVITLYLSTQDRKLRRNQICDINSAKNEVPEILFFKKWEAFHVLYAGFKDNSWISKTYLFWLAFRIIVTYFLVTFLYAHPLIQTIQLTILSSLMLFCLIKLRPFHDWFGYTVAMTFEVLVFITNICLASLAILDATGSLTTESQYGLSKAILFINTTIDMCGNIFMYLYILLGMRSAYYTGKKYGACGKTMWIAAPLSCYSNPGMDWHDFTNYETLDTKSVVIKNMIRQHTTRKSQVLSIGNVETMFFSKPNFGESDGEILSRIHKKAVHPEKPLSLDLNETADSKTKASNFKAPVGIEIRSGVDSDIEPHSTTSLWHLTSPIGGTNLRLLGSPIGQVLNTPQSRHNIHSSNRKRFSSIEWTAVDTKSPKQLDLLENQGSDSDTAKSRSRPLNKRNFSEQMISSIAANNNLVAKNMSIKSHIPEDFQEGSSSEESAPPVFTKIKIGKADNQSFNLSVEGRDTTSGFSRRRVLPTRSRMSKEIIISEKQDSVISQQESNSNMKSLMISSKNGSEKSDPETPKNFSEYSAIHRKSIRNEFDYSIEGKQQDLTMGGLSTRRSMIGRLFFKPKEPNKSQYQDDVEKRPSLLMRGLTAIYATTKKDKI